MNFPALKFLCSSDDKSELKNFDLLSLQFYPILSALVMGMMEREVGGNLEQRNSCCANSQSFFTLLFPQCILGTAIPIIPNVGCQALWNLQTLNAPGIMLSFPKTNSGKYKSQNAYCNLFSESEWTQGKEGRE